MTGSFVSKTRGQTKGHDKQGDRSFAMLVRSDMPRMTFVPSECVAKGVRTFSWTGYAS